MMKFNSYSRKTIRFSVIIILLGIAEICWTVRTPVRAQNSPSAETPPIPQAYWNAIEDARTPTEDEIFDRLTAITHDNNALTWDQNNRVLVVTWTHHPYSPSDKISTQDVWVTVAPDLQNFCKHYTPTTEVPLVARINQVLGLPPIATETSHTSRQIAEIWVDPNYLFRPSPDPGINDQRADVSFFLSEFLVSLNYYHWFFSNYDQRYRSNEFINGRLEDINSRLETVRNDLNEFQHLMYEIPTPWTQLGYTYDWGSATDWAIVDPNRPDDVGLSEFVIPQGSPIAVKATQSAEDYCANRP